MAADAAGLYLRELATSDVPLARQVSVVAAVESSTGVLVLELMHVVGLFGGMVAAAVGLFRAHAVARWAPVAIVVGLLGSVDTTDDLFIAAAGALLLAGLGNASARLLGSSAEQPRAREFASASAA